jgi:hypothetical protein
MSNASMDTCVLFANELIDHLREYCYLFDVAASILLWRGSLQARIFNREFSTWCPMDSLFLLGSAVMVVEQPIFFPSIILFGLAYILLRRNYFLSTNPSPWHRATSFRRIAFANLGKRQHPESIKPSTGEKESEIVRRVEEYRMHRTTGFIYESLMIILQVYQIYSKTTPVDISTVEKSGGGLVSRVTLFLTADYLALLHMLLKCT